MRWRRRGADQGGAVIVEAAIVLPVLFFIVFGALEYGLMFRDGLTGSNVVRAGGRSLSAQANSSKADQAGIQAMIPAASFSGGISRLTRVVVYFATCADPPTAYVNQSTSRCAAAAQPIRRLSQMTGAGAACIPRTAVTGVAGRCNVYSGTQLTEVFANDDAKWGCVTTTSPASPDNPWCPTKRIASQATGTDYIGLHIEYTHDWVTKLFGERRNMTDNVIFRVEPQGI